MCIRDSHRSSRPMVSRKLQPQKRGRAPGRTTRESSLRSEEAARESEERFGRPRRRFVRRRVLRGLWPTVVWCAVRRYSDATRPC
eukprot:13846-Prymnesium_polylepis.1